MKRILGAQCDDFHVSSRLFFKLDLSLERETILHFFERIRREYPDMKRFRRRDNALILEENDSETSGDSQQWIRLEPNAMRFGYFAPVGPEQSQRFARFLLEQAPHHLTLSDLDIDHLEITYGFDMEYRGNHDQLVAETLYRDHPLASFIMGDECAHTVDCQPYFGISLSPMCDLQAYLEVKSRTNSFEIRTGEYESQLLSVNLSVHRYWGFEDAGDLPTIYDRLVETANELAINRIVPLVVNPLALAIASRP